MYILANLVTPHVEKKKAECLWEPQLHSPQAHKRRIPGLVEHNGKLVTLFSFERPA